MWWRGDCGSWDWVATGRVLAATRWASNLARTSLRMRCKKAVKSVWAGSGAGGSGGCTVVGLPVQGELSYHFSCHSWWQLE